MCDARICKRCGEEKSINEFRKHNSKKEGRRLVCEECGRAEAREWYRNNPIDSETQRERNLKNHRGITIEYYQNLFEEQKGCCKICGRHQSEIKKRLAVDHCHDTGEIRGLLCNNCNTALELFKDNTENLDRAINYLNRKTPTKK